MDKLLELFKKRKELADEIAAITAKIKSAKTDEELAEIETKQKEVEAILSELQEVEKQIAEESARIETEQKLLNQRTRKKQKTIGKQKLRLNELQELLRLQLMSLRSKPIRLLKSKEFLWKARRLHKCY